MKLIIREHINHVEVNKKIISVTIDAVNSYNKIPAGIGLMKGDLIAFRGAGDPVRLPVGSDGKALLADSSMPTGLRWGDVAGGGGGATVEIYNQTGATIPAGSVVGAVPYIGADDFVGLEMFRAAKYTAGTLYVLSDDCPNNSTVQCYCVPDTVCPVLCDTDAVAQDDLIGVAANGACHSLETYDTLPLGRATVGIALEAKAEGSVGTVKVRLVSNPTIQAHSESAVSTTYGTCFMAVESDDSTFRVAPVKKGKQPFGVQANKESVAGAVVLLHTHQNEEVAVMADTTEIKVGDWLVPSATADGQVRNGSGYGIGEALTAKISGPAGLVRVHLNLKYGISPRVWWLPTGITEDQVIGAWQFVDRNSEAEALINVNNGTEYALTNNNSQWNSAVGFYFPNSGGCNLRSATLKSMSTSSIYSVAFGFAGLDTTTSNRAAGGYVHARTQMLVLRGILTSTSYLNKFTIRGKPSDKNWLGPQLYESGVLSANFGDALSQMFYNGSLQSLSSNSGTTGDVYQNDGIWGQTGSAGTTSAFSMNACVMYRIELTAEQHLELTQNIKALGGLS